MWIDKSAKQMHADAIAARQTNIALESSSAAQAGGRDGGSAPAWNTGPRSARRLSHAATGLPVARVAAGGRECVEHFTRQWFCGAQHTKSARRRAGYPERLDARRRGAVDGAHRVDQGDGGACGTESDREAHGEGDRNVSDPEDTSVMRAEAVSDEDVGTRYPRRGSRVAISSRNRDR